jgi:hypothetical protein
LQSSAFVIAVFTFVLMLFSLSFHECAHAWMASRLGDQTARLEGRITLNPMYHADPIGTLLVPALIIFGPFVGFNFFSGILIGWAKPTPVITRNFRKIVRDDNLVTLAGPASNLVLVLLAFVTLALVSIAVPGGRELVRSILLGGLAINTPSGLQATVILAFLAIEVNLSLPYNAVQQYDRIPIWVSYLFMIFVGGYILHLLIGPAEAILFYALVHI